MGHASRSTLSRRIAAGAVTEPAGRCAYAGTPSVDVVVPRRALDAARVHRSTRSLGLRLAVFVVALELYAFLIVYVLFLRTELRNGDKGFFFRSDGQSMAERSLEIERSFWERLAPYDGQWYLDIAANGYRRLSDVESRRGTHAPGNFAFFPLLPAVLWGSKQLAGAAYLPLTLLLGLAASAVGVWVAAMLARDLGASPYTGAALLVAFPTAAFRLVLYPEAFFLCLSALALYGALAKRPRLALAAGVLAGLSRPQGLLLALPFAWEFLVPALCGRERLAKRAWIGRALVVLSPLAGLAVMSLVSTFAADSPSAFLAIQERWGRSSSVLNVFTAFESVYGYRGPPADLFGLAFGVLLLPVVWRRLPRSLALYGTATLLLPLATGSLLSLGRFVSVSIPHFLALALLLRERHVALGAGTLGGFALAQIALASGLIAWHLVG